MENFDFGATEGCQSCDDLRRERDEAVALLNGAYAMLDELVTNENTTMTAIEKFLDGKGE